MQALLRTRGPRCVIDASASPCRRERGGGGGNAIQHCKPNPCCVEVRVFDAQYTPLPSEKTVLDPGYCLRSANIRCRVRLSELPGLRYVCIRV